MQFTGQEAGTDLSVCVDTTTTSLDGQTILEQQDGCTFDSVGAWQVSGGFITGVADTTVSMSSTLGGTSDVTVSAATVLIGTVTPTLEVVSDTENGCTTTWTIKERHVAVSGSVTVGGVVYPTSSDTLSIIRQVKTKTKC